MRSLRAIRLWIRAKGINEGSASFRLAVVGFQTHQAHPTSITNPSTTQPPAFATQSPVPPDPAFPEPPSKPLVFHSGAHSSIDESSASISNAWDMTRTTRHPRGRAANPSRRETRGDWSTKGCCGG